jgi:YD repeat-containing protein
MLEPPSTSRRVAEVPMEAAVSAGFAEHDLGSSFVRLHRPDERRRGAFGPSFRTVVDAAVTADDGCAVVSLPTGRLRFVPTSTGWLCTAGPLHRLDVDTDGWRLHTTGRATLTFDRVGRLRSWRSPTRRLDAVADSSGRVIRLHDRLARRRLHLDWTGDAVAQISDDSGTTATYTYGVADDELGRLVRVRRPDGVVTYRWSGDVAHRHHQRRAS